MSTFDTESIEEEEDDDDAVEDDLVRELDDSVIQPPMGSPQHVNNTNKNDNDNRPTVVHHRDVVLGYFKHCGLEDALAQTDGMPVSVMYLAMFAEENGMIQEIPFDPSGKVDVDSLCKLIGAYYRDHPREIGVDLTRSLAPEVKVYLINIISEMLDDIEPHGLSNETLRNLAQVNKSWNVFAAEHDRYKNRSSEHHRSKLRDYIAKFWASAIVSIKSPLVAGFSVLMPFGDNGEYRVAMTVRRRLIYGDIPTGRYDKADYYSMLKKCYVEVFPTKTLLEQHDAWFSKQIKSTSIEPIYKKDDVVEEWDLFIGPRRTGESAHLDSVHREYWGGVFDTYSTVLRKDAYPIDLKLAFGTHYYVGKTGADIDTSKVSRAQYDMLASSASNGDLALEPENYLTAPYVMRWWDLFEWLISSETTDANDNTEPYNYYTDRKYDYKENIKSSDYVFDIKKVKLVFHPWLSKVDCENVSTEDFLDGLDDDTKLLFAPLSEVHPFSSRAEIIKMPGPEYLDQYYLDNLYGSDVVLEDEMLRVYLSETTYTRGSGIAWYWFMYTAMKNVQINNTHVPIPIYNSSPVSAMNLFYSLYTFGRWPEALQHDEEETETRRGVFRHLATKAVDYISYTRHNQKHARDYVRETPQ
jgi:hypothetical protein